MSCFYKFLSQREFVLFFSRLFAKSVLVAQWFSAITNSNITNSEFINHKCRIWHAKHEEEGGRIVLFC